MGSTPSSSTTSPTATATAATIAAPVVAAWCALANGAPADLTAAMTPHGRQLGNRVELDVAAFATVEPAVAAALVAYDALCRQVSPRGSGGSVLRRRLVTARQSDAAQRADLTDELEALRRISGLSALVDAATDRDPDWARVAQLAAAYGGSVEREDTAAVITATVTHPTPWPLALGGPGFRNELARVVTLNLRHAAWRDRRVRRLAGVEVDVDEWWPTPAPYTS